MHGGPKQRRSAAAAPRLSLQAFNFTVANEDCNLYSYDMRKLTSSTCVHKVRSGAVALH